MIKLFALLAVFSFGVWSAKVDKATLALESIIESIEYGHQSNNPEEVINRLVEICEGNPKNLLSRAYLWLLASFPETFFKNHTGMFGPRELKLIEEFNLLTGLNLAPLSRPMAACNAGCKGLPYLTKRLIIDYLEPAFTVNQYMRGAILAEEYRSVSVKALDIACKIQAQANMVESVLSSATELQKLFFNAMVNHSTRAMTIINHVVNQPHQNEIFQRAQTYFLRNDFINTIEAGFSSILISRHERMGTPFMGYPRDVRTFLAENFFGEHGFKPINENIHPFQVEFFANRAKLLGDDASLLKLLIHVRNLEQKNFVWGLLEVINLDMLKVLREEDQAEQEQVAFDFVRFIGQFDTDLAYKFLTKLGQYSFRYSKEWALKNLLEGVAGEETGSQVESSGHLPTRSQRRHTDTKKITNFATSFPKPKGGFEKAGAMRKMMTLAPEKFKIECVQ
jgi:hypothetical protein